MPLSADILSQLEERINRIASEIVLAQPGSDEALIPIYSLLSDIGDMTLEEEAFADAVAKAKAALDELLDNVQPFDQPTLEYLTAFTQWGLEALRDIQAARPPKSFELEPAPKEAAGAEPTATEQPEEPPEPEPQATPEAVEPAAETPAEAPAPEPDAELVAKVDIPIELNLDDDRELLEEFQTEAQEHLEAIESAILTLEGDPRHADSLAAAFRAFHTIKGVAGFLHLVPVQFLAHEVESLMDLARNSKLVIDSSMASLILESRDAIQAMVNQIATALDSGALPEQAVPVARLIVRTQAESERGLAIASGKPPPPPPQQPTKPEEPEKGFFDNQPLQEENEDPRAAGATPPAPDRMTPVVTAPEPEPEPEPEKTPAQGSGNRSNQSTSSAKAEERATIRVSTTKLDNLMDMVGELVIVQSQLAESARGRVYENSPLQTNLSQLSRITKELQHTSMSLRMVPIKPTFQKTTRIVRDVAQHCGKKVNLTLSGEDTELDRTVVEQISDPLIHMIRNAIDHGIETPEKRLAAGKAETGEIHLSAYHMGSSIVIELADDGAGIDPQKILAKARSQGILREGEQVPDEEAYQFIFHAGFSTAEKLSDVSGRGVGMDVVRKNIEKLRGAVEIDSHLGSGSTFKIKLPLTMAIIDGMVVRVGEEKFILPTTSVKLTLRATPEQLSTIQGRAEILDLRGRTIPITRLHQKFGITDAITDVEKGILVIVENFGKPFALLVDEMVSKQEVVIKSLGNMMQRLPGVAGGAILGDGTIAIILDPASISNQAA